MAHQPGEAAAQMKLENLEEMYCADLCVCVCVCERKGLMWNVWMLFSCLLLSKSNGPCGISVLFHALQKTLAL